MHFLNQITSFKHSTSQIQPWPKYNFSQNTTSNKYNFLPSYNLSPQETTQVVKITTSGHSASPGWHQSLMEPKTPISFVSVLRSIKSVLTAEQHQLRFWRLLSTLLSLRTGWADHSSKPIRWFQKAIISEWLQSPRKDFAIWRTQTNVEHMAFHGQLHFEKQTNWHIYIYIYFYSLQFHSSFQPHIWDPESFNRIHVIVKTTLPKEDPT